MNDFDTIIDKSYDVASGVLLAISKFMNEHLSLLSIDMSKREHIQFSLFAMSLSIPGILCQSISYVGDNKQLNIEIDIHNTDRAFISQVATMLALLVYEKYTEFEQYMFCFNNPRMLNSWVRYKNAEIKEMASNASSFGEVLQVVQDRGDFVIFNSSDEEIDLNEVKYFCFSNIITSTYKINNIQDASIEEYKRLKACLYVGDEDDKQKLLAIFNEAIEKIKAVKNPPSPAIYHKNGSMEADSLYINVYRFDSRKSKELFPNNDNFVCMLDYNANGITTLKDGGIPQSLWKQLHHETRGNLQIAWREGKFVIRNNKEKIGRNDPCSCGSGKKFKKCCGR